MGAKAAPMGPADPGRGRTPSLARADGGEGEREGGSEFPVVSGFLPNGKLRHVPFGLSFW